jgi:hypothetical protein
VCVPKINATEFVVRGRRTRLRFLKQKNTTVSGPTSSVSVCSRSGNAGSKYTQSAARIMSGYDDCLSGGRGGSPLEVGVRGEKVFTSLLGGETNHDRIKGVTVSWRLLRRMFWRRRGSIGGRSVRWIVGGDGARERARASARLETWGLGLQVDGFSGEGQRGFFWAHPTRPLPAPSSMLWWGYVSLLNEHRDVVLY